MKPKVYVIFTTCGNQEDAKRLARVLAEKRIAACAQVSGPITSYYWWEDALQEDSEWQVKFKVLASNYEMAERLIRENHPYDLPQIIALQVEKALPEFINWVAKETLGN